MINIDFLESLSKIAGIFGSYIRINRFLYPIICKLLKMQLTQIICELQLFFYNVSLMKVYISSLFKRLCIKPRIQEWGTECGERGNEGNVIFLGMSPNILVNIAKHSGECPKAFLGMSPNYHR